MKRGGGMRAGMIRRLRLAGLRLRTAAGFVLLLPSLAPGGTVPLSDDTASAYVERGGDGANRLRLPDEEAGGGAGESGGGRCYAVKGFLALDNLSLDSGRAELSLDSGGDSSASLVISDYLSLSGGRLRIAARSPEAETAALTFTGSAADGRSAFIQTGGEALIESGGDSIGIDGGNAYKIQGGTLSARARGGSAGLRLIYSNINTGLHDGSEVFFGQTGGRVLLDAADAASGLVSSQSAEISGGALDIAADDKARGIALTGGDAAFRQTGGTVSVRSAGDSAGLSAPEVHIDGGSLYLESGGRADAVRLGCIPSPFDDDENAERPGGLFLVSGGEVRIARSAGNPGGHAVWGGAGSLARFGAESALRPVLDADSSGAPVTGLISVSRAVIEPGAKLDTEVRNAARIRADAPLSVTFLESREAPVEGRFSLMPGAAGERQFYRYEAKAAADGKSYRIDITPKRRDDTPPPPAIQPPPGDGGLQPPETSGGGESGGIAPAPALPPAASGAPEADSAPEPDARPDMRVSDILRGNNRRAALALENALRAAPADSAGRSSACQAAGALYDSLYNSDKGSERRIAGRMRALSPYQAARLPDITLSAQSRFARDLRAAASERAGGLWLTPSGAHMRYDAERGGSGGLSANEGGMSFGASAQSGRVSAALGGAFGFGRLSGADAYRADARHLLAGGALSYALPGSAALDMSASFGGGRFRQHRGGISGGKSSSTVRQRGFMAAAALVKYYELPAHHLRLAPQAGLDYAFIRQSGWRERGGALPLSAGGADFNALRPKIGGGISWKPSERLSLSPYAYYLYDILDRSAGLNARLRGLPGSAWRVRGGRASRSAADMGFRLSGRLRKSMDISALYGITARSGRTERRMAARIRIAF